VHSNLTLLNNKCLDAVSKIKIACSLLSLGPMTGTWSRPGTSLCPATPLIPDLEEQRSHQSFTHPTCPVYLEEFSQAGRNPCENQAERYFLPFPAGLPSRYGTSGLLARLSFDKSSLATAHHLVFPWRLQTLVCVRLPNFLCFNLR